jgi:hypothetical protein
VIASPNSVWNAPRSIAGARWGLLPQASPRRFQIANSAG